MATISYKTVQEQGTLIHRSEFGATIIETIKYKNAIYYLEFISGMLVEFRDETNNITIYKVN